MPPKRYQPYPFRPHSEKDYVQRKLVELFSHPFFPFELPQLSQEVWKRVCDNSSESQRLEFVGDAIIGAMVAEEIYQLFPQATPGFYTCLKTVLLCNSTFAHLMRNLGYSSEGESIKPVADAFEVIMAAYHHESGSAALREWVRENYSPLIKSAGRFCETYRGRRHSYRLYDSHEQPSRSVASNDLQPWTDSVDLVRPGSGRRHHHGSSVYETGTLIKAFDSLALENRLSALIERKEETDKVGSAVTLQTVLSPAPVAPSVIKSVSLLQPNGSGSATDPIVID